MYRDLVFFFPYHLLCLINIFCVYSCWSELFWRQLPVFGSKNVGKSWQRIKTKINKNQTFNETLS